MKPTTMHNGLAAVVQMYTEMLEHQARENLQLQMKVEVYEKELRRLQEENARLRKEDVAAQEAP